MQPIDGPPPAAAPPRRGGPGRLLVVGVAVVAVLVGAGATVLVRAMSTSDGQAARRGGVPGAAAPGASAVPRSKVVAGEGGTGRAADGETHRGFSEGRDGAVAAATAYAMFYYAPRAGKEPGETTIRQIGTSASVPTLLKNRPTLYQVHGRDLLPQWGGFRVEGATDSGATVLVLAHLRTLVRSHAVSRGEPDEWITTRTWLAVRVEVRRVDGDWHLENVGDPKDQEYLVAPFATRTIPLDEAAVSRLGAFWERYANAPAAEPEPSPAPVSADGAPPGSAVVAGKGGTATAEDGVTAVGFPDTDDGAVAAATAYNLFFRSLRIQDPAKGVLTLDRITDPALRETFHERQEWAARNEYREQPQGLATEVAYLPQWGAYRIATRTADTATIEIFGFERVTFGPAKTRTEWRFDSVVLKRIDGDWRLVANDAVNDNGRYGPKAEQLGPRNTPLPGAEKTGLLGPGWREYADATR